MTLSAQPGSSSGDAAMARAESLLNARKFKEAIKAFNEVNARQDNTCDACYWGIAQAYWGLADYKNTEENCDRVLQYAGANVRLEVLAHALKGVAAHARAVQGDRGRFKEAEREFQAAYKLDSGDPHRATFLFNLGLTELQNGEKVEGIATLKSYLGQVPTGQAADLARRIIANPRLASAELAPDFSLRALDGQTYSLGQLRGKIVLLDFWASWCPPCRDSVLFVSELAKRFSGEPFVIISISSDTDAKVWRAFIQKHKMVWPQYRDSGYRMRATYNVHVLPTFILIDQDGAVLTRQSGWGVSAAVVIENLISEGLATLASQNAQSSKLQTEK
ncbi:MAG: redoxin family protein [Acidobacteria bacterium]|nr:redoxin family protein [Acidobacteriota bacterium]